MILYTVVPHNTEQFHPQDFEDLYAALMWQDELAMEGIKSTIEKTESFFVA